MNNTHMNLWYRQICLLLQKICVMKFAAFLLTMFALYGSVYAKELFFPVLKGVPIKVLPAGKQTLLINESTVSLLNKQALHTLIDSIGLIADASLHDKELWLATNDGVKVFGTEDYQLKHEFFKGKRISALGKDVYNRMWVATSLEGIYMQNSKDNFETKLTINGAYSLMCTADSNIWVGTNVGMYRLAAKDFSVTRYAEEGYSGYELPDNIVEHLYKDDQSNIWVVMPDNISFKSSTHYQGEIPSYAYIGDKNNEIRTIVPLQKMSYLFVTEKGIFLLPSLALKEEHEHGSSEVFTGHETQAFDLSNKQLGTPEALKGQPVLYAEKANEDIYFITASGGWRIKEKDLIKRMLKG